MIATRHLTMDSATLSYVIGGTGSPPLVFVHGGFCDHTDWRYQLSALRDRFTVLALDLRGHGKSVTNDPDTCRVETFARDVWRIVEAELDTAPILVGHSLGCRILLAAHRQKPDGATGLVLVDGSRLGSPDDPADDQLILGAVQERGQRAVLEQLFTNMFVGRVDPAVRDEIMRRLPQLDEGVVRSTMRSTIGWDAADLDDALAAATVPMLAVQSSYTDLTGRRHSLALDETSTPWLELLRTAQPALEVTILPGLGHFCMLEDPEGVNAAIAGFAARFT